MYKAQIWPSLVAMTTSRIPSESMSAILGAYCVIYILFMWRTWLGYPEALASQSSEPEWENTTTLEFTSHAIISLYYLFFLLLFLPN